MSSDGAHGWNIDIDARTAEIYSVRLVRENEVGKVGVGETCICTLLGPEGPEQPGMKVLVLICFFWTSVRWHHLPAWRGTARTLRTTQWTRAS